MKTILKTFLILLIIFITTIYLRTLLESQSHLELARASRATNSWIESINEYHLAILFRSPGNRYSYNSAKELLEIVKSGVIPKELEVKALWEIRAGIIGSRSFLDHWFGHYTKILDETATLLAERNQSTEPGVIKERLKLTPDYFWQIISQILFISWIASVSLSIWRGFTADGKTTKSIFQFSASSFILFCFWLYSIWKI